MPLKPVPVAPAYRWNSTAGRAREGRYIDAGGRIVSRKAVRQAIDDTIEISKTNVRLLAEQLRTGAIDPVTWRNAMMRNQDEPSRQRCGS